MIRTMDQNCDDSWDDDGPWKAGSSKDTSKDSLRSNVFGEDGSREEDGPWNIESPRTEHQQNDSQLSLLDLFYVTTLFGLVMGLYSFISPWAAIVFSGGMLVYLILRFAPVHYGTLGGLQAFGTSVLCLPAMLSLAEMSAVGEVVLCLAFPSSSYVLGAIYTELRALDG